MYMSILFAISDFTQEKRDEDTNYFFKESAFLNVFTSFLIKNDEKDDDDDEPEDL